MQRGWLWFVIPLVAAVELSSAWFFARRAPSLEQWRSIVEPVRRLRQPGDALIVSPGWAEPLARHALGDSLWPLADVARPGFEGAGRVIEVSTMGERADWLSSWPVLSEFDHGVFHFSVHENPNFAAPLADLLGRIERGGAEVFRMHEGTRYECPYKANAQRSTGGLHGHVAFPNRRFICGKTEVEFVGVTIIDDQQFRPRRCVWAPPAREGTLWLRFDSVPLGRLVRGHVGRSHFLMRDGRGADVVMEVFVDGQRVGRLEPGDRGGWQAFEFATQGGSRGAASGRLEFKIQSQRANSRHFCFFAETA